MTRGTGMGTGILGGGGGAGAGMEIGAGAGAWRSAVGLDMTFCAGRSADRACADCTGGRGRGMGALWTCSLLCCVVPLPRDPDPSRGRWAWPWEATRARPAVARARALSRFCAWRCCFLISAWKSATTESVGSLSCSSRFLRSLSVRRSEPSSDQEKSARRPMRQVAGDVPIAVEGHKGAASRLHRELLHVLGLGEPVGHSLLDQAPKDGLLGSRQPGHVGG